MTEKTIIRAFALKEGQRGRIVKWGGDTAISGLEVIRYNNDLEAVTDENCWFDFFANFARNTDDHMVELITQEESNTPLSLPKCPIHGANYDNDCTLCDDYRPKFQRKVEPLKEETRQETDGHQLGTTTEHGFTLLPCPFCGVAPMWVNEAKGDNHYWIHCPSCNYTLSEDRRDKVAGIWNSRPENERLWKENEETIKQFAEVSKMTLEVNEKRDAEIQRLREALEKIKTPLLVLGSRKYLDGQTMPLDESQKFAGTAVSKIEEALHEKS